MHRVEHRVIYGDTDAGQVVYYANYFRWFESGRREIFRSLKIDDTELDKSGIITPVVEAHCNYFHPARYVYRKKDKKLLASVYTINVCVDKAKMKSISIPVDLRKKLRIG